ncbi:MAG: LCP family protein [Actinobacteria bacterium]|nr:LCP family protein [Actinomycetota bacterium]MBU4218542.1 LCP family protein [Actinomycetota bacterium]MBU4401361.1 LCP family protein [Actinomycetota bacterium]MCG2817993.1 LCP family protein [Actinomycetes bacterium]
MQDYVGYRTRKRLDQKGRKRKWWRWLLLIVVLVAAFVILGKWVEVPYVSTAWESTEDGFQWMGRKIKSVWPFEEQVALEPGDFLPEGKETANYLIAVTKQFSEQTQLSTIILASYDSSDESGSLAYFPNDLMVNVPGIGMDQLSNLVELDEERISMTLVTVENLLGIEIDRYVMCTDRDLRIVLNQISDSFTVDVPSKLSYKDESLDVTVDLKPGEQKLSGNILASYLTYSEAGKKLELIARQKGFAPVLLKRSRDIFGDIEPLTKKNANLFDTDASNAELAGMWQAFSLLEGNKLLQGTLPVKEFRYEKTVVHRVDNDKLEQFVKKYLKSPSNRTSFERVRLEVLNGCGVPGIGENVAAAIDMNSFEVVSSANANNFDYPETVIIIYSEDRDIIAAAEKLQNELEVGRIESHPQVHDMSDITVIVGKDYASK